MAVFVNRMLNLKKVKVIGFDMDYTLVGYHTKELEKITHKLVIDTLIKEKGYPEEIRKLKFNFNRSIVGLVIDKRKGNLLKLSRYSKVKLSYHGLKEIGYPAQNRLYQEMAIDIKNADFKSLDTSFSISIGVLYSQLVQLREDGTALPDFYEIAEDVSSALDTVHQNDSLKSHTKWQELFEIVITLANKPNFFTNRSNFLEVDEETGLMKNHFGPVSKGIYQGGWFKKIQTNLGVQGSEILYLGDHIYGDVVSIKKSCNWRTALVLGDLEDEISNIRASKDVQREITSLMREKSKLEAKINRYDITRSRDREERRKTISRLYEEIDTVNGQISEKLAELKGYFNPYWGEILRAGMEESRFADQVERYACIYMTRVSDLYSYSPKTYFRPLKRLLPHEIEALK